MKVCSINSHLFLNRIDNQDLDSDQEEITDNDSTDGIFFFNTFAYLNQNMTKTVK